MNTFALLSPSVWLSLPQDTRNKLVKLFSLTKSGNVSVIIGPEGGYVESDGYTPKDLMGITVEGMQDILGSKQEDFYWLFKRVVDNIDDLLDSSYVPEVEVESTPTPSDSVPEPVITPKEQKNAKSKAKATTTN